MTLTPFNVILFGVVALLGVGFYGLLITRNLIKVVMVLQILIKGVILALVLAGTLGGNPGLGQSTAATVIVADTIVAVVGLALAVQVRRRFGGLESSHDRSRKRLVERVQGAPGALAQLLAEIPCRTSRRSLQSTESVPVFH